MYEQQQQAVRIWKRDGSQNVMALGAAVCNVKRFYGHLSAEDVRSRLLAGQVMESPLAEFVLAG